MEPKKHKQKIAKRETKRRRLAQKTQTVFLLLYEVASIHNSLAANLTYTRPVSMCVFLVSTKTKQQKCVYAESKISN